MIKSLWENVFKLPDNFFDPIVDERECIHYRAALDPRSTFVELYQNLSFRVHVHLHLREHLVGELADYCAVFGYNPIANWRVDNIVADFQGGSLPDELYSARTLKLDVSHSPRAAESKTAKVENSSYNMNDSMLIGVIYGSENTESIVIRPVQSFVRLESLNNCGVFRSDHSKVAIDFTSIFFGRVEDRELKPATASIIGWESAQLVDKQVKRGASVMGEIADDDTQLIVGCDLLHPSNDDIVWWCRVSLKNKGIGLFCDEIINRSLDSIEVLLSPAKLQSWPIEWVHMLYSRNSHILGTKKPFVNSSTKRELNHYCESIP